LLERLGSRGSVAGGEAGDSNLAQNDRGRLLDLAIVCRQRTAAEDLELLASGCERGVVVAKGVEGRGLVAECLVEVQSNVAGSGTNAREHDGGVVERGNRLGQLALADQRHAKIDLGGRQLHLRLRFPRIERHHAAAEVSISDEMRQCGNVVAAVVRVVSKPELALGVIIDPLPIVGFTMKQLGSRSRGLDEPPTRGLAVALEVSHLRHQHHRSGPSAQRIPIEILKLLA